jgi:hypothetical protein
MRFTPVLADAILPSLALVWPLFILLLIPIVAAEALYSRRRLKMGRWECIRVLGIANILSSIAGLPLGQLFGAGLQYATEGVYFRNPQRLHGHAPLLDGALKPIEVTRHDYMRLMFLGIYPRWIMLLSAALMLVVCFLVSWWVEAKWVKRYLAKRGRSDEAAGSSVSQTIRNANLLSYGIVAWTVLCLFNALWPA